MQVDVERSGSYTRRLERALRRRQPAPRRGAEPGAAARRRPLRPGQGARRHRALPQARRAALRPRGPRVRLLPHGHGQPRERPARRSAAAGASLRGALLRLDAAASRGGLRASSRPSATTPPTTSGSSAPRWRSCGSRATTGRDWTGSRRCRRPTTPPARCCSTARRRAICARSTARSPTPRLEVAPDLKAAPRGARRRALRRGQGARDLRRAVAEGHRASDGGWTFRVARTYASDEQALAFQYVLDRLQVLNVIAWSRAARSINVTASRDAKVLEPLLDRLGGSAK